MKDNTRKIEKINKELEQIIKKKMWGKYIIEIRDGEILFVITECKEKL